MTFYNNTPYLFQKMAGNNVVVNYLTCGSRSLYQHGEWIHKVLESDGIYKNFEKNLSTADKNELSNNSETRKAQYDFYASALFQDYTGVTNTKKLTPISYDYVILQDRTDNMSDTANFNSYINNSSATSSRDYYKSTWKGGLCRVIYELRNNGVTNGHTKYVINAIYTGLSNKEKLSAAEVRQTKIDNQAVKLKDALASGFKVPGNKTFALGSSDVKVAYTGDVVLSYLHDTIGKNTTCTKANISALILEDHKHPKLAASVMQAATIYRTIYGKQPPYLTLTNITPAYNMSSMSSGYIPSKAEYTFYKNNKVTLYKYVQNYGTTTKAAWK